MLFDNTVSFLVTRWRRRSCSDRARAGALGAAEHGQSAGEVIVGDSALGILELIMVWHVLVLEHEAGHVYASNYQQSLAENHEKP
jgi:hypothetical protein